MKPAAHTLDQVNYVNIGLMLVSGVLAYLLPFHLFLAAYAILGPLHYLTEISWLHDRQYFSRGRFDFLLMALLAIVTCYPGELHVSSWTFTHDPMMIAFFSAIIMAFIESNTVRVVGFLICILFSKPLGGGFNYQFFGLYLPTLVHVFAFTWIFVLYGSIKSRSRSGFLSLAVMTLVGAVVLFLPPPATTELSEYVQNSLYSFGQLHLDLSEFMGWEPKSQRAVSAMRFIAFAYTYHYLNWFSKTKVISWHQISRVRLAGIIALYAVFVGTYAYDYSIGLKALYLLSLGHVLFELPLNMKSIWGVHTELRDWIRPHVRKAKTSRWKKERQESQSEKHRRVG